MNSASTDTLAGGDEPYRTLFSAVGEAVALCEVVVDADGRPTDFRVLEVNAAFAAVTGIEQDAVGRTARELVPSVEDQWIETCARAGLGRETVHAVDVAVGLGRWFDVHAAPVGPSDPGDDASALDPGAPDADRGEGARLQPEPDDQPVLGRDLLAAKSLYL